jgi:hypothetical protein
MAVEALNKVKYPNDSACQIFAEVDLRIVGGNGAHMNSYRMRDAPKRRTYLHFDCLYNFGRFFNRMGAPGKPLKWYRGWCPADGGGSISTGLGGFPAKKKCAKISVTDVVPAFFPYHFAVYNHHLKNIVSCILSDRVRVHMSTKPPSAYSMPKLVEWFRTVNTRLESINGSDLVAGTKMSAELSFILKSKKQDGDGNIWDWDFRELALKMFGSFDGPLRKVDIVASYISADVFVCAMVHVTTSILIGSSNLRGPSGVKFSLDHDSAMLTLNALGDTFYDSFQTRCS